MHNKISGKLSHLCLFIYYKCPTGIQVVSELVALHSYLFWGLYKNDLATDWIIVHKRAPYSGNAKDEGFGLQHLAGRRVGLGLDTREMRCLLLHSTTRTRLNWTGGELFYLAQPRIHCLASSARYGLMYTYEVVSRSLVNKVVRFCQSSGSANNRWYHLSRLRTFWGFPIIKMIA